MAFFFRKVNQPKSRRGNCFVLPHASYCPGLQAWIFWSLLCQCEVKSKVNGRKNNLQPPWQNLHLSILISKIIFVEFTTLLIAWYILWSVFLLRWESRCPWKTLHGLNCESSSRKQISTHVLIETSLQVRMLLNLLSLLKSQLPYSAYAFCSFCSIN